MAKKKKHKKKQKSILDSIDYEISSEYESLIRDVEEIQYQVYLADQKKKRRNKRKARQKYGTMEASFLIDEVDVRSRIDAVYKLTNDSMMERIFKFVKQITPVVIIGSRLIATFIVALLNVDAVKANLTRGMFDKLQAIYNVCLGIGRDQTIAITG